VTRFRRNQVHRREYLNHLELGLAHRRKGARPFSRGEHFPGKEADDLPQVLLLLKDLRVHPEEVARPF